MSDAFGVIKYGMPNNHRPIHAGYRNEMKCRSHRLDGLA
jgi:hypothetical protein